MKRIKSEVINLVFAMLGIILRSLSVMYLDGIFFIIIGIIVIAISTVLFFIMLVTLRVDTPPTRPTSEFRRQYYCYEHSKNCTAAEYSIGSKDPPKTCIDAIYYVQYIASNPPAELTRYIDEIVSKDAPPDACKQCRCGGKFLKTQPRYISFEKAINETEIFIKKLDESGYFMDNRPEGITELTIATYVEMMRKEIEESCGYSVSRKWQNWLMHHLHQLKKI